MQKITTFLWFDDKAEEVAKFYVSIFKNSRIGSTSRYGEAAAEVSGRPKGTVMTVAFQLDGQEFVGLNGGPHFQIHGSHIPGSELRDAAGSRRVVAKAF